MTIRVFLLDDHEVVRTGLRQLLESSDDLEVVGEAGTAADAIAMVPGLAPDVAVLDARLPDDSGIEVCRRLRDLAPSTRSVILTSFDDDEALFASIMAGASGYVLKQVTAQDLVAAVRHVATGGSLLDPSVTAKVLDRIRGGQGAEPDALSELSAQERRILELVAEGLTNRQIGERLALAEKTVRNYMTNVLAKLGLESRTQAAVFANRSSGRA